MKQDTTITLADIRPRNTADVEWQVIHDMIQDDDILPEVLNIVSPDYFTTDGRKQFWNAIVSHFNAGDNVPGYRAFSEMPNDVHDEYISFRDKVSVNDTFSSASTKDQAISHITVLRNEAARRRAYFAGLKILQMCSGNANESEVYALASEAVQSIEDKSVKEEYSLREIFDQIAEDVQERKSLFDQGRKTCIASGIPNLDNVVDGGFKRGNLIVIAARPSVGKTALAIQLMRNTAAAGNKTVFFSIEMMKDEIGNRILYSSGEINSYQVWTGNMDWPAYEYVSGEMGKLPILVNDHARNLSELVSRMTVLSRQGKCDIAFVDYLGLINASDKRIPLYQQIAEVTGTMKVTAKRLGIPIVLLCQLNRDAAKDDCDPDLYHLRDSGSIEQDADIVLMLRRNGDDLDVLVRKNRHGDANLRIKLATNATRTNYRDIGIEKI